MRVLYLAASYTVHDARFIAAVTAAGHSVTLVRLDRSGSAPLPPGAREVAWSPARADRPAGWAALAGAVRRILADERPDIVHAGPIQSCGYVAALAGARPLLLMSWASDLLVDPGRDAEWRGATAAALEAADLFACDSNAVAEEAVRWGYPSARIVVFPWGVDLGRFVPGVGRGEGIRRELGIRDEKVVLSTRSWEPIYAVDVLLEAFALALARQPDLFLILLGGGLLAKDVDAHIRDLGLERSVARPGMVDHDDLPRYFAAADVYASCSRSDGTSVSLLEAMACGIPPVVRDIPGNREWVTPGRNGWLVADDAPGFADAILAAARLDPHERERIAREGRAEVEARADLRDMSAALIASYERAVAEGAGRS